MISIYNANKIGNAYNFHMCTGYFPKQLQEQDAPTIMMTMAIVLSVMMMAEESTIMTTMVKSMMKNIQTKQ